MPTYRPCPARSGHCCRGRKKVERETTEGRGSTGKKQKGREVAVDPGTGIEYFTDEAYEIERLLDKKMVPCKVKGKKEPVDYPQFLVLWKGWPPESATWQWPAQRGVKGGIPHHVVAEYEAGLEAEAQLEAEEAAEDEEESNEEDEE